MSNIVLSDKEIRRAGEDRWSDKNGKRGLIIFGAGIALTFIAVEISKNYPTQPVGFIAALVIGVGLIYSYARFVMRPQRKAGEEFLKEYRK